MVNKKSTRFIAFTIKAANKRMKEEAKLKKIQREVAQRKRKFGCCSDLPTDTNWDAVYEEMAINRFYEDKRCKGCNNRMQHPMLHL